MPTVLFNSRSKAFKAQSGRCIYCELPMWQNDINTFARKHHLSIAQARLFQCTAEHLQARQDGGSDHENNIVAACLFCNKKRHQSKSPKHPISYKRYVTNRSERGKWNSVMMSL